MRANIKFLVMDVDGTLTDGKLYFGKDGELMKAFFVRDGYAIREILPQYHIEPIVITARESGMTACRCRELGIKEYHQNCKDKLKTLRQILERSDSDSKAYDLSTAAYIGDDIPDLDCMSAIKAGGGLTGCPADAVGEIKNIADFICSRKGGEGAVREFIEWIVHN